MKIFSTLASVALMASYALAFSSRLVDRLQLQIPSWIRLPTMSKLPLFIHDLRHQWLQDNIAWLERRPDPLNDLCGLSSSPDTDLEGRNVPADLFECLHIDNNRAGISRRGWINLRDRIQEIRDCPAALQGVTCLYLDIWVDDGGLMNPGENIIHSVAEALISMPNLKRVRWGIPADANKYFKDVFARRGLRLPSVTHLTVGAFGHHMVSICPNLETLKGGSYLHHWSWNYGYYERDKNPTKLLLQEASHVPTITSLEFEDKQQPWNEQLVRDVLGAVPNLTNLTMEGEISGARYMDERMYLDGEGYSNKNFTPYLETLLQEFKPVPNLTHLCLPAAWRLGLGFDGGPPCGNAYFGPGGREYRRRVSRQSAETVEKAANITFKILPHLESISIGGTSPVNITRDDEGKVVELEWDWTGRMQEYLYELWPELTQGRKEYDDW